MNRRGVLERVVMLSCLMLALAVLTAPAVLAQTPEDPPDDPVVIDGVLGTRSVDLEIHGENFDKGLPNIPQVSINETEVDAGRILTWSADLIQVDISGFDPLEEQYNSVRVCVTLPPEVTPEGETEESEECDEACFHNSAIIMPCDFNDQATLAPVDRVVRWYLPNDPQEDTFHQYDYKFGPAMRNHKKHKFGDPVYYQLLDDYSVSLETYLDEFEENPWGVELDSRCVGIDEWKLEKMRERLDEIDVEWSDDDPENGGGYLSIRDGILTVRKGYRWDGPSLEAFDHRILAKPSALMRATIVHDAVYDLMRLEVLKQKWVRVVGSEAYWNRKMADCLFFMFATQDHYRRAKAVSNLTVIRLGGASKTKEDLPSWKFHAVADAGEYEPRDCADPQGTDVVLDGSGSRHAIAWDWEVENPATATVQQATGEMARMTLEPGIHEVNLTVDDGDDGEEWELYRDTDTAVIELNPDISPPVFLLADDRAVVNDPGQCSAMVDFNIIATDDCGPPVIECTDLATGEPVPINVPVEFPVGTTHVSCVASDIGGNRTERVITISVTDVEPPVIHGIDHALTMWPPNHRYKTYRTGDFVLSLEDNCTDPTLDDVLVRRVTSDEPENGPQDGNTMNDIVIAQDGKSVKLRSERQGGGNGRVYTAHLEVADAAGNLTTDPFQVHAIMDKNGQAIDDGVAYTVEFQPAAEEEVEPEEEAGGEADDPGDVDFKLPKLKNPRTAGGGRGR